MRTHRRYGLSLIEVVLGLAIGVGLLVALGSAMTATATNVRANQSFFSATQGSRLALRNIVSAVRCADDVDVGVGAASGGTATASVLYMRNGSSLSAYVWDSANTRLLYDKAPPSTTNTPNLSDLRTRMTTSPPTVYILSGPANTTDLNSAKVTALSFKGAYGSRPSPTDGTMTPTLVNVQISMTLNMGTQSISFQESVVPRRVSQP
jgi:hypothetical protein